MNAPDVDYLVLVKDVLIGTPQVPGVAGLSEANCYVAALASFVPGSPPFYVQVIDDGASNVTNEQGTAIGERIGIRVSIFKHLVMDRPGRVEELLTNASEGIRVARTAIRNLLTNHYLGGVLHVGLRWVETTPPSEHPEVPNWISQDLRFIGVVYHRQYGS